MTINQRTAVSIGVLLAVGVIMATILPLLTSFVTKDYLSTSQETYRQRDDFLEKRIDRLGHDLNKRFDKLESKIDNIR